MLMPIALGLLSPAGLRGRLSILIFHRVLPAKDELFPTEVDAAAFDQICAWVSRWFRVLPLDEAARRLREGRLPERALAITFDDGYADNHDVAMPLLQRHGLTATFFVATGFLNGGRMWNDTVIESIRRCPADELNLDGLPTGDLGRHPLSTVAQRRQTVESVIAATKYLEPALRLQQVQAVAARAGAALPADLMMSSEQVRGLVRGGMSIGAHTVHHLILAGLPAGQLQSEITDSKRELEAIAGSRVGMFAYPNGAPGRDYDAAAVAAVHDAGFDVAVTTAWGAAALGDDLLQLPRFTPWDRSSARFGLRMAGNLWQARRAGAALAWRATAGSV